MTCKPHKRAQIRRRKQMHRWLRSSDSNALRHDERDTKNLSMAEIQLYAPMAGTQLSSFMVQPQNPNCNCLPQWQRHQLLCFHGREPNFLPTWYNVNFQQPVFFKSSNYQPISSEHDVIHTPASFPVWGLLWQWWLSYPLRASVKLYPTDSTHGLLIRVVQSPTKLNDKI